MHAVVHVHAWLHAVVHVHAWLHAVVHLGLNGVGYCPRPGVGLPHLRSRSIVVLPLNRVDFYSFHLIT